MGASGIMWETTCWAENAWDEDAWEGMYGEEESPSESEFTMIRDVTDDTTDNVTRNVTR